MKKNNSGVIKQILKDHFDGYWTMCGHNYPDHKGEQLGQAYYGQLYFASVTEYRTVKISGEDVVVDVDDDVEESRMMRFVHKK